MALARIITRSHACARELALDLLARGYTVEIVSPDKIPDNLADLELRVDAGPGDQLVATVETHNGERSASIDFVHHLKSPMTDFVRRPAEPIEIFRIPQESANEPVSPDAEPTVENVERRAVPLFASVSEAPEVPVLPESIPESIDHSVSLLQEAAQPELFECAAIEPATFESIASEPMPDAPTVAPQPESHRARPAGWFWQPALTFAGAVMLALILGLLVRRTGKAAALISSSAPPPEKVLAAPIEAKSVSAPNFVQNTVKNPSGTPLKAGENQQQPVVRIEPPVSKPIVSHPIISQASSVKARSAKPVTTPQARAPHKHGDELVARDTVTYLDPHFKPAPKPNSAKRVATKHHTPNKHSGGVIAANSVTYLNNTPAQKPAK
jgi:hypothetical protein